MTDIIELTAKVKARAKNRTKEESLELLKRAEILDEDGELHPRWFNIDNSDNEEENT